MKPEFIEPSADRERAEYDMGWLDPPVLYRHWRRGLEQRYRAGDWIYPGVVYAQENMRDWVHVGWAPKPRGRRQAFLHHYRHGRLMGYTFLSVLVFALRHGEIGRDV